MESRRETEPILTVLTVRPEDPRPSVGLAAGVVARALASRERAPYAVTARWPPWTSRESGQPVADAQALLWNGRSHRPRSGPRPDDRFPADSSIWLTSSARSLFASCHLRSRDRIGDGASAGAPSFRRHADSSTSQWHQLARAGRRVRRALAPRGAVPRAGVLPPAFLYRCLPGPGRRRRPLARDRRTAHPDC